MKKTQNFYKYLFLIITTTLILACSEHIVENTPSIDQEKEDIIVAPKFSEIQTNIFNQSCALSGCHISGSVSPDLSGNSYSNIFNKVSSTGKDLIEPNDPDNSYLLQKVIGSSGINGSRMPLGVSALSQTQIDALTDWINDGAQNN